MCLFNVAPLALRSGLRQRGTVCPAVYPPLRLRLRSPQGGLPSPRASGALIAQIPNIIANLDSVAMAEVLKTRRIHFILSPAAGVRCSRWQALKAVWLPARDWIRFGAIRPFLFLARPSCEMLYFETLYLMTPRSESSMNLMSMVTSSLKPASALSFSRAWVVLSLEFSSSL